MKERWTVGSVNGQTTGKEGEWKNVNQIEGHQTRLIDNVFGIHIRAIKVGGGEFIPYDGDILNMNEREKNNNAIQYALSEISMDSWNEYANIMRDMGMDVDTAFEMIKKELNRGTWSHLNVDGLREYGVVIGIITKLEREDVANKTRTAKTFRDNSVIELMRKIEWAELEVQKKTPEEVLAEVEMRRDLGGLDEDWTLLQKKYEKIYEKTHGKSESELAEQAEKLEEFMVKNGMGPDVLSYLLVKGMGSKAKLTGIKGHIAKIQNRIFGDKDEISK